MRELGFPARGFMIRDVVTENAYGEVVLLQFADQITETWRPEPGPEWNNYDVWVKRHNF